MGRVAKPSPSWGMLCRMRVLSFPWWRGASGTGPEIRASAEPSSSALLARAVDALPDAVLVVGRTGAAGLRILAANQAARELLRIRPEEEQLLAALRQPDVLAAVEQALAGSDEQDVAYETAGPRSRALRAWIRPLQLEGHSSAVIVLRDETEARRLERMRADFLANASHELRTPLASLAGFIETLQGHAKNDPAARERFLDIMLGQARRMSRLIDDLLSLSRIELNEHVPPSETCDVARLAREAADALLPTIVAKGLTLEIAAPGAEEAIAIGERDQIMQVVQNLLENAVKYSSPKAAVSIDVEPDVPFKPDGAATNIDSLHELGGGRLILLSPERGREDRFIRISVADTGPGMAREHLPRLTERFYRIPGQKSGDVSGTGLGLAIVKHIVNRHRGALLVESVPGGGTAFAVYIPAAASPTLVSEPVAAPDVTKVL